MLPPFVWSPGSGSVTGVTVADYGTRYPRRYWLRTYDLVAKRVLREIEVPTFPGRLSSAGEGNFVWADQNSLFASSNQKVTKLSGTPRLASCRWNPTTKRLECWQSQFNLQNDQDRTITPFRHYSCGLDGSDLKELSVPDPNKLLRLRFKVILFAQTSDDFKRNMFLIARVHSKWQLRLDDLELVFTDSSFRVLKDADTSTKGFGFWSDPMNRIAFNRDSRPEVINLP
jgi:hypothetical protein